PCSLLFALQGYRARPALLAFPTRRSSDLVMPHVGEAHAALCELLVSLAEMIEKNKTEGPDQEVWDRFHAAQREALACLKVREAERDSIDERAIQTLLFGLEEIRRAVSQFQVLATDGPGKDDGALT